MEETYRAPFTDYHRVARRTYEQEPPVAVGDRVTEELLAELDWLRFQVGERAGFRKGECQ